ncbi:GNAT family N-acetyltransferase [Vagococcus carniphilus]|uniref:GNAT family N-acetyltransferase n=1 Tax=Vagococcus carniphilus TaxID=218144 RepID=A0AAW8U396_9ENTE|nr:GNAT family N-acetyltransferase [Vagococcus carniphilus]MDT2813434.1 GNAT family N-acetyltransferase [Vagococcus carniphilus]MDT2833998.1 GNAT family N-acetyltransferase [Vagococcus carniphilus]MDT2865148.1 GNAT family N-acetyltransferase [Vagococcus carniphilus]
MFQEEKNRFVLKEEGKDVAEITWQMKGLRHMVVDHTFVDSSQRGKGLAEQLVLAVIEKAKKEDLKIIPTCSYVVSYFDKHKEYNDLIAR